MKTLIKKNTESRFTGNKKIKLSDWENQFLSLLDAEDCNPVFTYGPGSVNLRLDTSTNDCDSNTDQCSNSEFARSSSSLLQPKTLKKA